MQPAPAVLAIDQGTTGTTVLLVEQSDTSGERIVGQGYREIPQQYPQPGWVEHDPEAIWGSVLAALESALAAPSAPSAPAAIGITNQRETIVVWDRKTGAPVAPAIVWQDRRTTARCEALRAAGHEPLLQRRTGLVIDPYFTASKLAWLLDEGPRLRAQAEAGALAAGTIDSWLIYKLTGGAVHATDVSNAARTQLLDLETRAYDPELCALFGIPEVLLPEVRPSAGVFGHTRGVRGLPDGIPIAGAAGDQQAALFGQGCVEPGQAKCTFGTGSFLLMNVGARPVASQSRLLCTVAWTVAGQTSYALEGGAFVCGALVQWLRDGLGIIGAASEIEALAQSVPSSDGVVIVPAFTGLGAPHWRPEARGAVLGLHRGTTRAHLARAALEAMAQQNVDIVRAMEKDAGQPLRTLRVDGGATANNLLMHLQADLLGIPVERPSILETTAIGAARLAAIGAGLLPFPPRSDTQPTNAFARFVPRMAERDRQRLRAAWQSALPRAESAREQ